MSTKSLLLALEKLRVSSNVETELSEIHQEYELSKNEPEVTIGDLFRDRFLRRITFIAAGAMICQQLSGIGAVWDGKVFADKM